MANADVTGTVKIINDVQTFPSGFTKRTAVIETDDKYPQLLELSCLKDRTKLLDAVNVGDVVEAQVNINGREYNGRYYTELVCWRIKAVAAAQPQNIPPMDDGDDPFNGEDLPF